jgi:hypothetical protein
MAPLKIFLSYSSLDKKLAGIIKHHLQEYELDVFLAHEDIEPSTKWLARIKKELASMNVFLPLVTKNFAKSDWTDQETGYALARGVSIIPLKTDIDPYGFAGRIQALSIDESVPEQTCLKIAKIIHTKKKLQAGFLSGLIMRFAESSTYEAAKKNSEAMNRFGGYSPDQANEVLKVSLANGQIYGSFGARDNLRVFIRKHEELLDKKLVKALREKIG